MTISMHSASVPVFQRQLGALLTWLDKAEAHAQARGFPVDNFVQLRLAPDMLPFVAQIRIASDSAKACMARLAGQDNPKFEDNETTMAELRARIARTIDYVGSVPASAVDGSETRGVSIPRRDREPLELAGENYLRHYALPNFFFHCSMAYALLRQGGVAVGKSDFLGAV